MFTYTDVSWPFIYLPLANDFTDFAGNGFAITNEGTGSGDFSTRADWLTLNGTDNYIKLAYEAALETLFTVGGGSALFMCRINMATPATVLTLLSAVGGKQEGTRGIRIDANTGGNIRVYLEGSQSSGTGFGIMLSTASTHPVFDGNDHSLLLFIDVENNNIMSWIDGLPAESGRERLATREVPSITDMGYHLTADATPDVVFGGLALNTGAIDATTLCPCEVQKLGWINFGTEEITHIQLNKMARDYHQSGLKGSNFT